MNHYVLLRSNSNKLQGMGKLKITYNQKFCFRLTNKSRMTLMVIHAVAVYNLTTNIYIIYEECSSEVQSFRNGFCT